MKERPILFNTEMIRVILDGRKTMTRRVIKPQPTLEERGWEWVTIKSSLRHWPKITEFSAALIKFCPYGQVGDRLWVRETHYLHGHYKDSHFVRSLVQGALFEMPELQPDVKHQVGWHKRPSIFLHREHARIWLEITEVRVERVQEISEEDIRKEGHQPFVYPSGAGKDIAGMRELGGAQTFQWFMGLWDSLNAKRSSGWEANPWVWVISFKEIK